MADAGAWKFEIRRDGEAVCTGRAANKHAVINRGAQAGHNVFPYSWYHAERHEGYSLHVGQGQLKQVSMGDGKEW